jgi:hypothetical protein
MKFCNGCRLRLVGVVGCCRSAAIPVPPESLMQRAAASKGMRSDALPAAGAATVAGADPAIPNLIAR